MEIKGKEWAPRREEVHYYESTFIFIDDLCVRWVIRMYVSPYVRTIDHMYVWQGDTIGHTYVWYTVRMYDMPFVCMIGMRVKPNDNIYIIYIYIDLINYQKLVYKYAYLALFVKALWRTLHLKRFQPSFHHHIHVIWLTFYLLWPLALHYFRDCMVIIFRMVIHALVLRLLTLYDYLLHILQLNDVI